MSKIGKNTLFSLLANHPNLRENSRRLHLHAVSLFDQTESLIGRLCCFLPMAWFRDIQFVALRQRHINFCFPLFFVGINLVRLAHEYNFSCIFVEQVSFYYDKGSEKFVVASCFFKVELSMKSFLLNMEKDMDTYPKNRKHFSQKLKKQTLYLIINDLRFPK